MSRSEVLSGESEWLSRATENKQRRTRLAEEMSVLEEKVLPHVIEEAKALKRRIRTVHLKAMYLRKEGDIFPGEAVTELSWNHIIRKFEGRRPIWKEEATRSISWTGARFSVTRVTDNPQQFVLNIGNKQLLPESSTEEILTAVQEAIQNPTVYDRTEESYLGRDFVYPDEDPRGQELMQGFRRVLV